MVLKSKTDRDFDKAQSWYTRHTELDMQNLQNTLVALRYLDRGNATGHFNRETYEAVKTAQTEYNKGKKPKDRLVEDGIYGGKTGVALGRPVSIVAIPLLKMDREEEQRIAEYHRTSEEDQRRGDLASAVRKGTVRMEPGTKGPVMLTPEAYKERLVRLVEKGFDELLVQGREMPSGGYRYNIEITLDARKGETLAITLTSDREIATGEIKQTLLDVIDNNGTTPDMRINDIWVMSDFGARQTELYSYDPRQRRINLTALRPEAGEKHVDPGRTYLARVGDYLEKYDKKKS